MIKQGWELEAKNQSLVTNDKVGKIIILQQHIDNYFCKAWNINGNFNWLIMHYFYQAIEDDKNWVMIITFPVGRY